MLCTAALLCILLIIYIGSMNFQSASPTHADDRAGKVIYLTFDDGPSDRVTPKVLDVLKEENVKATFFIIGKNAETRKYIIEREIAEGHTVAVHSYSHIYHEIYSSADSLLKDIDKCNEIIKSITGRKSTLYRFPGGSNGLSDNLIRAVTNHGMRYIDWNASTRDAEIFNATPNQLFKAAISTPAASDYIVMLAHDSTTKSATAQALKDIIKYYKELDYTFAAF